MLSSIKLISLGAIRTSILSAFLTALSLAALLYAAPNALAQQADPETRSAQDCYEQSDQRCLKEMFADIVDNPSEEKSKAIYLLGQLKMAEGEDLEGAKDQFVMALMFADGYEDEALEKLNMLHEGGKVEFATADCTLIKNEDCFHRIIAGDDPVKIRNAQYLLGKRILEKDPVKALELFSSAIQGGHGSAQCELAQFYKDDELSVPADYQKYINESLDCPFQHPFKKFNEKHYDKYKVKKDHKAYALADTGYAYFIDGKSDPGYAATLVKKYCEINVKKKSDGFQCNVINVDGLWVKDAHFKPLPEKFTGVDDLINNDAQKAFQGPYSKNQTTKVFVQSITGNWSWQAKGNSEITLEALTTKALKNCDRYYKEKLDNRCVVVNVNGKWVDE